MLDLLIVSAFILYSISNGFRNRSQASRNLEEYFLAGRSIQGWRAGVSLAATQFAADTPLLVTGLIATGGIFMLWRLWIYGLGFLMIGFLLGRGWRRARVLTDAEAAHSSSAAALGSQGIGSWGSLILFPFCAGRSQLFETGVCPLCGLNGRALSVLRDFLPTFGCELAPYQHARQCGHGKVINGSHSAPLIELLVPYAAFCRVLPLFPHTEAPAALGAAPQDAFLRW